MVDVPVPKVELDEVLIEVQALKDQGLYNTIRTIDSPQGARLTVNGREVLNFCSNNYLGLASDPRLRLRPESGSGRARRPGPQCNS